MRNQARSEGIARSNAAFVAEMKVKTDQIAKICVLYEVDAHFLLWLREIRGGHTGRGIRGIGW